jgi:tRNA modification GTPase
VLLVAHKIDLPPSSAPLPPELSPFPLRRVSAKSGAGFDELRRAIASSLEVSKSQLGQIIVANARHAKALENSARELAEARALAVSRSPSEFVSLHLRTALGMLNEIVGVTTTDDVLGRIFSKFCIGK